MALAIQKNDGKTSQKAKLHYLFDSSIKFQRFRSNRMINTAEQNRHLFYLAIKFLHSGLINNTYTDSKEVGGGCKTQKSLKGQIFTALRG